MLQSREERQRTAFVPRPQSRLLSRLRKDIAGRSDPWRRGALDVVVPKDSRDLGTKTEALLASDVSIVEIDELRPLILEGQERGFLTFEQITSCLEEVEVTKEQVVELHAYLEDQGIDVVNAEDGRPAVAEGRRFESAAARRSRRCRPATARRPRARSGPRST